MILDDMEANPEKYAGKKLSELSDDEGFDEQKDIEYGEGYYKKTKLPKVILVRVFRLVCWWNHIVSVILWASFLFFTENQCQGTWLRGCLGRAQG